NTTEWTNVTSSHNEYATYTDSTAFCSKGALGAEHKNMNLSIWVNNTAKALPPGIFLICGDRAWQGLPKNAYGGPCYLGKLTLMSPSQTQIKNLTRVTQRRRRSLTVPSNCDDHVQLWGAETRIVASVLPFIGTVQALASVNKLACWAIKQANTTTAVLSALADDMDSLRHAILQNRAAIDFLLLAQRHGCEEFEGMCCFNLTNHSDSIHKQLKWLREHTARITIADDPFGNWLRNAFGGLSGWIIGLIKEGIRIISIVLIACIVFK
ncbi:ENR1 protein, partial [Cnemophilus loriae]|nr:ENR1 protein [Cnemophilus loriae]